MKLSLALLATSSLLSLAALSGCSVRTDEAMGETQAADVSYDTTLSFGYARTGLIDPGSTVLIAGSTLTVDYDPLRIVTPNPRCAYEPSSPDGVPRTSINMGVRLNGDSSRVFTFERVSLYGAEDVSMTSRANNQVALPEDTRAVEIWFFCKAKESGYVAYDSKFGANYKFAVAAKVIPLTRYDAWPKTIQTGRRNAFDVSRWYDGSVFPGGDDSYYYPTHVEVAYDDNDGFGGTKAEITAHVGLHTVKTGHGHWNEQPTEWHEVTLKRAGRRFVGQVDTQLWGTGGMTDHRVYSVELAVTNGSDWDSNLGRNYRIVF